jgi:hypothetical protein
MAAIKDNYIESQNLMKLSYEIENFDLGTCLISTNGSFLFVEI